MTPAEMPPLPPHAVPTPPWMVAAVLCLAAATMGASLSYMREHERPPSSAVADLDASSPPVPVASPVPACTNCGRVEAVLALAGPAVGPGDALERGGLAEAPMVRRKTVYQVKVRMDSGQLRILRLATPLAVGTVVSLQRGVLRVRTA